MPLRGVFFFRVSALSTALGVTPCSFAIFPARLLPLGFPAAG